MPLTQKHRQRASSPRRGQPPTSRRLPESLLSSDLSRLTLFHENEDEDEGYPSIVYLKVSTIMIGEGKNGTIVVKGEWFGRPAAVKCIPNDHCVDSQEVNNLLRFLSSPTIVNLLHRERDDNTTYLVFELYDHNLAGFVKNMSPTYNPYKQRRLMSNMAVGLKCLHDSRIVHRNLSPENVLIIEETHEVPATAKIGGFGRSYQLPQDGDEHDFAADMYSLGCVFFYLLTGGAQPFGNTDEDLSLVDGETRDVISILLNPNPETRLKASDLIYHPSLWNVKQKKTFISTIATYIDKVDLKEMQAISTKVFGSRWDNRIDTSLLEFNAKNECGDPECGYPSCDGRRYKYDSFSDLLLFVKNCGRQLYFFPPKLQDIVGSDYYDLYFYFENLFPELLIEVYKLAKNMCPEEIDRVARNPAGGTIVM